ncbi:hypothetical protein AA0481_0741 [Acetobacter orientalis NRIC 0481]|nr:hypothetical protein AA0481_0741 [Acetobacter orientalis NRIC 0481]
MPQQPHQRLSQGQSQTQTGRPNSSPNCLHHSPTPNRGNPNPSHNRSGPSRHPNHHPSVGHRPNLGRASRGHANQARHPNRA